MRRVFNECVGCTSVGLRCLGSACPNRNVERLYCDRCGKEIVEAQQIDGEELCEECFDKASEE